MSEQTEPTKAAKTPELWPIRNGGVYSVVADPQLRRRVTSLANGRVYYDLLHTDGSTALKGDTSPQCFRENQVPEDESPISDLVDALTLIVNDPDTRMRSSLLALAFAAITKAEAGVLA